MNIGLGVALVPWFPGWSGGIGVIAGPSGGYLIGFVVASYFLGHVVGDNKHPVGLFRLLGMLLVANFAIIYGLGLLQLYIWISIVEGNRPDMWSSLIAGAFPFVTSDKLKVMAATVAISGIIRPKKMRAKAI